MQDADAACDETEKLGGCETEVFDSPKTGLSFHVHSYKVACPHDDGWRRTLHVRTVRRNWGR